MKIKIISISKWMMYLSMIQALSLLKPIGEIIPVFGFDYAVRWTNILLMSCAIFLLVIRSKRWITNKYVWGMAVSLCVIVLIRWGIDFIIGRNVYKELNAHCPYFYIILAVAIYGLLESKALTLDNLIDTIIFFTLLSYILRAGISLFYSYSGQRILNSIALEGASENWFRGDTLRITAPCFLLVIIPLCFYRLLMTKSFSRRIYYIINMAVAVLFGAYVQCARGIVLFHLLQIAFCIFICRKKTVTNLILIICVIFAASFIVNVGIIDYVMQMFSTSNKMFGASNSIRYLEYPYFFDMFLDHFWFGRGLLIANEMNFPYAIRGDASDCGILRSLIMMGLPILLFYILWIGKGLINGIKVLKVTSYPQARILTLGISISVLAILLYGDCFFPTLAYAVPFALAIPEYVFAQMKKIE